MAARDGTPANVNPDMILGEIRGQLREVVHSVNNLTQKFDGLTREVVALAVLSNEVSVLKISVIALEADRSRRDGAIGIVDRVLRSPVLGWVIGAASIGIAVMKGWVQIP